MTNSAPAFPIRRPRTRKKPSPTRSRIWPRAGRWTGSSAAMSASARPKSRCAPPSSMAMSGEQVAVVVPTTLAGAPALPHLRRALRRLSAEGAPALALRGREGGARDQGGAGRRAMSTSSSAPMRCSPKAIEFKQSRPGDRRRGAAFRRDAQGTAEGAEGRCACADADRHADPAHAATGAVGRARSVADHHAADRPAGGAHLRHAVRSAGHPRGAAARALSRRAELLCRAAHRRSARGGGIPQSDRAGGQSRRRRMARWRRACWKT